MKPAHEWDWAYIQTLPVGEFDWLEAKGLGGPPGQIPKIDENKTREMLAKALSALANTGGGQFIWGVKDPDAAQGWIVENGGIPANHKNSTAEWLKNIISTLTDPPLLGFDVYTVTGMDDLREDHAVFVIDVKDSPMAPHQHANDKRYYGRVGGNSQPLGHRLVMDIMGRRQNPAFDLDIWIEATRVKQRKKKDIDPLGYRDGPISDYFEYKLWIRSTNVGRIYANYISLRLEVPYLLVTDLSSGLAKLRAPANPEQMSAIEIFENTQREVIGWDHSGIRGGKPNYGPARFVPVLPGRTRAWNMEFIEDWQEITERYLEYRLKWIFSADNAPLVQNNMLITEIKIVEKEGDSSV